MVGKSYGDPHGTKSSTPKAPKTSRGSGVKSGRNWGENKTTGVPVVHHTTQNDNRDNQNNQTVKDPHKIRIEKELDALLAGAKSNTSDTKAHKFDTKLKELYAKGEGNTQAAQVLKNYLSGITGERREQLGLQSQTEANKYIQGNVGSQEQDFIKALKDDPTMGGIDLAKYGVKTFADLEGAKGEAVWKAIQASPEWKAIGDKPGGAQQQYAITRKAQGVIAGGSLSGAGSLFKLWDSERYREGLPDDTDKLSHYLSTYMDPQQQAYVPGSQGIQWNPETQSYTQPNYGYLSIAGNEGIPAYSGFNKYGDLIKNKAKGANVYSSANKYSSMGYNSMGGYGGVGGSGYGGHGGGGGGSGGPGYGYSGEGDNLQRGFQKATFGPGNLLEQVNQNYMQLAGLQKKRGGIVSLLRLR